MQKITYKEMELTPSGDLKEVKSKTVSHLTSDCWLVQFSGIEACLTCPECRKADCGGGWTLMKLIVNGAPQRFAPIDYYNLQTLQQKMGDKFLAWHILGAKITGGCEPATGLFTILNRPENHPLHFALDLTISRLRKAYSLLLRTAKGHLERQKQDNLLDDLFPYHSVIGGETGEIVSIKKRNYHKCLSCDCVAETKGGGAYRDAFVICKVGGVTYGLFYYHQHCVAAHNQETGELTLDSCGYRTPTTKERINNAIDTCRLPGWIVQKKHVWYLTGIGEDKKFVDGMVI